MARENQGLQIALIIFVMLTIVLSVTTYLFYRQYDEATVNAKNNAAEANKKARLAAKNEDDANELKRLIGAAKTEKADAITAAFNEDMKKYGGGYPEESRFYRPLLEKMLRTIDEKNAELADAKAELQKLGDQYKMREASKEQRDKARRDLAGEQSKYKSERDRIARHEAKLQADVRNIRKERDASVGKIGTQLRNAREKIKNLMAINEEATSKITTLTSGKMGAPDGAISWVNQRTGTVWINLGRADALMRQVTFSVYPANITDITTNGKKGSIEVTRVLGDHLAEARILDDKIENPIMPGDKIFTPLWSTGKRRHFALAGMVDVDDDGRSDLETVINLIRLNGGVVDCYIADGGKDKNKQVGQITVNTNCLIIGAAPTEKGEPGQLDAFTNILRDADQFSLQKIQLGDVLQRMGWKNMAPVVRFGRGANPNDFRAKPDEGVQRKSTGNVSEVFKLREPPRAPAGGY